MDLLILGASARAAASSAIRLGLRPACADLFADADLAANCPITKIDPVDYPAGLATFAATLPPTRWLYTGAIENRPDLVDRISSRHQLLGNLGRTLRGVRDPLALAGAFRDAGIVAPEVRIDPSGLPVDGSWLCKPIASGGGQGICPWLGHRPSPFRPAYFQERVGGLPLAAIFVGEGTTARCLGLTRQYVGKPGNPFAYRGSLGPWPVELDVQSRVDRLGQAVASAFGLIGLFGIDLILREGQPWPIEVNPRYTASVEILEWSLGRSLLREHLRAFGWDVAEPRPSEPPPKYASKAIVHADRPFRWPSSPFDPEPDAASFPEVADVPTPGTSFLAGEPVLTVFARGETPAGCRRSLAARVRNRRRRLPFDRT